MFKPETAHQRCRLQWLYSQLFRKLLKTKELRTMIIGKYGNSDNFLVYRLIKEKIKIQKIIFQVLQFFKKQVISDFVHFVFTSKTTSTKQLQQLGAQK